MIFIILYQEPQSWCAHSRLVTFIRCTGITIMRPNRFVGWGGEQPGCVNEVCFNSPVISGREEDLWFVFNFLKFFLFYL